MKPAICIYISEFLVLAFGMSCIQPEVESGSQTGGAGGSNVGGAGGSTSYCELPHPLCVNGCCSPSMVQGKVSGNDRSGVTISLTGPSSSQMVTGADGKYVFDGMISGDYVITPSKEGYLFEPPSGSVTVKSANQPGPDFKMLKILIDERFDNNLSSDDWYVTSSSGERNLDIGKPAPGWSFPATAMGADGYLPRLLSYRGVSLPLSGGLTFSFDYQFAAERTNDQGATFIFAVNDPNTYDRYTVHGGLRIDIGFSDLRGIRQAMSVTTPENPNNAGDISGPIPDADQDWHRVSVNVNSSGGYSCSYDGVPMFSSPNGLVSPLGVVVFSFGSNQSTHEEGLSLPVMFDNVLVTAP